MKHLNLVVRGIVQGVFFRANTREVANNCGVKGFVRNDPDGSVYIEAEGNEEGLDQFTEWCKKGPVRAKVTRLEVSEGEVQGYMEFEIRR